MDVYEVMFIAVPLWFCLVGILFGVVFGNEVLQYLKSKSAPQFDGERPPRPVAETAPESHDTYPWENGNRKSERELVLK